MTNIYRTSEQSGRSMVEMLGVLAIVGVLSIGGIAGYSKAMAKYKINKTLDQVSLIITNIRTLFGNQVSYSGLTNANAIDWEIVSADIVAAGSSQLNNAFGGQIKIQATSTPESGTSVVEDCNVGGTTGIGESFCPTFRIQYSGMDRTACATILSSDWGSSASAGLVSIAVDQKDATNLDIIENNLHTWNGTTQANMIPISYPEAYRECESMDQNSIEWVYN